MKNTILLSILISSVAFAQTEKAAEPVKTEAVKAETTKTEAAKELPKEEVKKEELKVVEPAAPAKDVPAKPLVAVKDDEGFNKSWNVHVDVLAGSYESMGNSSLTFPNAGQYPTLTSGEKIPMNVKSPTTGFQFGGGYRFSDWLSWDMNLLVLGGKQESKITTSTGATHDVKLETGFVYFSPFTWTGYPIKWLYLQAGVGLVAEAHKVTTDIPNIGSFETGSFGSGINVGTGVEFALSKMFSLRGGLTLISAATITQEKKINEGQAAEVTAKWEERKIGIGLLTFGSKLYF
jgi:hypothetical protein